MPEFANCHGFSDRVMDAANRNIQVLECRLGNTMWVLISHLVLSWKHYLVTASQRTQKRSPSLLQLSDFSFSLTKYRKQTNKQPSLASLSILEFIYLFIYFLFIYFFIFQSRTCGIRRFPGQESNRSSSLQPTPQPHRGRIRAASGTYTIAHSSTGSLTHRARPGIEPVLMDPSRVR